MLKKSNIIEGLDIVSVDKNWQYPAITEKHAFHKVKELVPYAKGVVYFAFPWATLIDLKDNRKPKTEELMCDLSEAVEKLKKFNYVITVCQHIRMKEHEELFDKAGVDMVFWSHAVEAIDWFGRQESIKIKPFPLYPVHVKKPDNMAAERKFLFSFVGAKSNQWYLTKSRNYILEYLKDEADGFVKGRESWHYNDVVYKHQINQQEYCNQIKERENTAATEYNDVMADSAFLLCPSGSGPNSIRLWESIESGVVPVILSDKYCPPGDERLWSRAVVKCNESAEEIKKLPEKLRSLIVDKARMYEFETALNQIRLLYGREVFVTDIISEIYTYASNFSASFLDKLLILMESSSEENKKAYAQTYIKSLMSRMFLGSATVGDISIAEKFMEDEKMKGLSRDYGLGKYFFEVKNFIERAP